MNKTCPECGKKFHACCSCYLDYDYEYEYCSLGCYKKSLKYDEKKKHIIQLMRDSFTDIYKLDDLTYYLQKEIADEIMIFLEDEEIREVWNRR